ncbi:hypothetical protein PS943_05923 [Pseudomonas fluorescens]|uniref:Transmembrane protein n=2 Tax=Pseudomonas fluorescens TaxID=294 RepID=A0A5E7WSL3_PSEFL|nr:hypothetical protein PS943_05923 [Pseudomonas fluorescens]
MDPIKNDEGITSNSNEELSDKEKEQSQRQIKPYAYIAGTTDNDNEKVIKIYSKSLSYIVYRTDRAIRIDIDDEHKDAKGIGERHYRLSVNLARIYSWLPEDLSKSESINRLVARAITANAAGFPEDAKQILAQAEDRLVKLKTIQGRLQYTLSALTLVFIVFVISLCNGLSNAPILFNIVLLGSLGGVLSIALGFSSLEIDLDASGEVNCLIGCSRILIAIAASIFSYFAIQTDVAFSFVAKSPENSGFYMIAMVAGFAEMLIPNIMSNLIKEGEEKHKNKPEPT